MVSCARCILNSDDDPALAVDENGVCGHCRDYDRLAAQLVFTGAAGEERLRTVVRQIRETGAGKKYDCILGVSGGVDSTYLAYLAHQQKLRPLVVHFDNGWN